MIGDEQAEAAAAHVHTLLTKQHELLRGHPSDQIVEIEPGRTGGFADTLYLRYTAELAKPGLRLCRHAARRLAQPLFYRVWKPGRLMCRRCMPTGPIAAPTGHPCEFCGKTAPGQRLCMQAYQLAFVVVYLGLCHPCTDQMLADLKGKNQ